eukprot:598502-Hanusia_phi.AAC.2
MSMALFEECNKEFTELQKRTEQLEQELVHKNELLARQHVEIHQKNQELTKLREGSAQISRTPSSSQPNPAPKSSLALNSAIEVIPSSELNLNFLAESLLGTGTYSGG